MRGARAAAAEHLYGWRAGAPLARRLAGDEPIVDAQTDACIAGYPRSGNTVAYFAFRETNPGARIAHHVHTAGPILSCAELGVPCAVLIRPPLEAISSLLIFHGGRIRPGRAVSRYVHFYERVAELGGRVALCRFEDVLADPAVVARELNARFGTSFADAPLDEATRERLSERIEQTQRGQGREASAFAIPRPEKEAAKPEANRLVAAHRRFPRAEAIYESLTTPG